MSQIVNHFFRGKKTILCCVETTKREKKWNIVGLLQTNQVLFTALCLELPGNVTPSYGTYFKNYCYSDIGTYNLYRGYSAHELIFEIFPKQNDGHIRFLYDLLNGWNICPQRQYVRVPFSNTTPLFGSKVNILGFIFRRNPNQNHI